MIKAEKIQENWKEFRERISTLFPTRKDNLLKMYDDLQVTAMFAPASSFDYFHNAIPGGYVDHVLRVHDNAILHYELWAKSGMKVDNFSIEELHFAALHHDLGKLGLPGSGNEHYIPETSKWHKENQGKIYRTNPNIPKLTTFDNTLFLLNYYGIKYSLNEMIGIRCTDGMYEDSNGEYLKGFALETKVRNNMPYILHHADMMAFRYEFERWNNENRKLRMTFNLDDRSEVVHVKDVPKKKTPDFDEKIFDNLFPDRDNISYPKT